MEQSPAWPFNNIYNSSHARLKSWAVSWNTRVLTESVSGDRWQGQSVVSHRLILDYLQINKENYTVAQPSTGQVTVKQQIIYNTLWHNE